jgi:Leucine rich repeat
MSLSAWMCGIVSISKKHFHQLSLLRRVALNGNEIHRVTSDTFEDLTNLEWLFLDNNRIKFLDVHAFEGLSRLQTLSLQGNLCIDRDFTGLSEMAEMHTNISENCTAVHVNLPVLEDGKENFKTTN